MLQTRSPGFYDERELAIEELKNVKEVSYITALTVLNDMNSGKYHPDLDIIVTYKGHIVLSIMDGGEGEIVGIAYDTCEIFDVDNYF